MRGPPCKVKRKRAKPARKWPSPKPRPPFLFATNILGGLGVKPPVKGVSGGETPGKNGVWGHSPQMVGCAKRIRQLTSKHAPPRG